MIIKRRRKVSKHIFWKRVELTFISMYLFILMFTKQVIVFEILFETINNKSIRKPADWRWLTLWRYM